jgi:hypothetical protein
VDKLRTVLKKGYDYTGNKLWDNTKFCSMLAGILEYDPERRMTPKEILESEFICSYA